jgi:peptidyl-prolyl cis-trans isomerase C
MNITRSLSLATVSAALFLVACQGGTGGAPKAEKAAEPASPPVALVDGRPISTDQFEAFIKAATQKAPAELTAEERQNGLDSIIRLNLLAAQAEKDGLDKDKELANALVLQRMDLLQRAVQNKYLKDKTPTEQELRAEYETQVAAMSRTEYKARHILVQKEDFANLLLERLRKGEKFEQLAARESQDSSKERGGDLGWFAPATMVKPFADAVMGLKKGQTTAKPVATQFGFHIIRLDDTRDVQPPAFDQVKPQLTQMVYGKKFRAYTEELVKLAKVEKKL